MGKPENLSNQRLDQDLALYQTKAWHWNRPGKDYTVRPEDLVPALSGVIGKIALVAAFAVAWKNGLGIETPDFVTENVRLELFVASMLAILFSAVLHPRLGPPGTLAPLIPLVPAMAAAGVHPLAFGLLLGAAGIALAASGSFSRIMTLTGPGTKSGILLLFGLMGIVSSLRSLWTWTQANSALPATGALLSLGIVLVVALQRFKIRWLVIPGLAALAILLALMFRIPPQLETGPGLPLLDPGLWWLEKWGLGWPDSISDFIKPIPFVLLAIVMWPTDALAIQTILENNYGPAGRHATFLLNPTYLLVSVRNIIGVLLGGAQTAAIWRSFMIPLGVVRRPIGASALFLGLFGLLASFLGFPLDWAVFPLMLWPVLIFGVYLPMVENGIQTLGINKRAIPAALACLAAGWLFQPVVGWILGLVIEKLQIILMQKYSKQTG
ncbi:MAG: DUF3360 family protein [Eubacteriales bacterium]|nr:DUF3360 family protein [Eubacteriales bacterium]